MLVTSLLYPWGYKEFNAPSIGQPPDPTSYTGFEDFIFVSQRMREITERATRAASSDYTVFVTGESGVGKEGDREAGAPAQLEKRKALHQGERSEYTKGAV